MTRAAHSLKMLIRSALTQEQGTVVSWKEATMMQLDMDYHTWICLKSWCTHIGKACQEFTNSEVTNAAAL